jgi:hypothetical protein
VLDRAIVLGADRPATLRTSVPFVAETAVLYRALEDHGSV